MAARGRCVRCVAAFRIDGAQQCVGSGTAAKSEDAHHDREHCRRRRLGIDVSRDVELSRARNEFPAAAVSELTGEGRDCRSGNRRRHVHRMEHVDRPASPEGGLDRHVGHGRLQDVSRLPQPPQRTTGAPPDSLKGRLESRPLPVKPGQSVLYLTHPRHNLPDGRGRPLGSAFQRSSDNSSH